MRELVYLSERKLQQFVSGRPRRWPGGAEVEAELKIPGLGGVKFGHTAGGEPARGTPDLDKVISALDSSDRAARWFEDDEVENGGWIHFEAPLSYGFLDSPEGGPSPNPTVIFVNRNEATTSHPSAEIRLLLHGSSRHLQRNSYTRPREDALMVGTSDFPIFWREVQMFLGNEKSKWDDMSKFGEAFTDEIRQFLGAQYTASWMAGYARVTALIPTSKGQKIMVATPLYVEYVSPPP